MLGELLRGQLDARRAELIVLGLARGGVPVATEVARALGAALDVCVVRKLGAPAQPEFAFGAIAEDDAVFIDAATVAMLRLSGEVVEGVRQAEARELESRVRRYRGVRPLADVGGKHVVLVDDGLATGATMRAAIRSVRHRGASGVTVAVPVGAPESVEQLRALADVVCLHAPPDFSAVGPFYDDFSAPTDDDIRALLRG